MKIKLNKLKRLKKIKITTAKVNTKENNEEIDKKENNLSFSLTKKETKLYHDWIKSLRNNIEIDDSEDSYVLYPTLHFSPYEIGVGITATVGSKEITLRTAWEDDET